MAIEYVHTNLVAGDWRRMADFYRQVFDCRPVPPEKDHSGRWLDRVTGLEGAHITGQHLRLPGHGENGPTLEIFQYDETADHPDVQANTPGFTHLAFAVDDVARVADLAFALGGSPVGELTMRRVAGVGTFTVQYIRDPEGNIVEIQKWDREE